MLHRRSTLLFAISALILLLSSNSARAQALNATYVQQIVPVSMIAGQSYKATVTMQNSGTTTWAAGSTFKLGTPDNNTRWGLMRVVVSHDVQPGQAAEFAMTVTAPTAPGSYNFQWQMVQENVAWFGMVTPNVVVNVQYGQQATFVSQSVPTTMVPGQTYSASVTMLNSGNTTWPGGGNFRLATPDNNTRWGLMRVVVPRDIGPGEEVTFNFPVTAPSSVGSYGFQWQMIFENVTFFGPATPNVMISVQTGLQAAFVSQVVPATMETATTYQLVVKMRNSGPTTWPGGTTFRLATPDNNLTWGLNRVAVPSDTAPGQDATFTFNVVAPTTPGSYGFQWQMVFENVAFFGSSTPATTVTVRASQTGNQASFIAQSIPTSMFTGQTYPASITFRNSGSTVWQGGSSFKLGTPNNNTVWGLMRVVVPQDVLPGEQVTFAFNVTAPTAAGSYAFQWRMVIENVTFFGDQTPSVSIAVTSPPQALDAAFVSQSVSPSMVAGQSYPTKITFKNVGWVTWPGGSTYRLGTPDNNTRWGFSRVVLPHEVLPGEEVAIDFVVTAPSTGGNYPFQWRLLIENIQWFGPTTPNQIVTVGQQGLHATFVSQTVPSTARVNETIPVSVTMLNSGTVMWKGGSTYRLGTPTTENPWGVSRVVVPTDVQPGQQVTFTFSVLSWSSGPQPFQWQMVLEDVMWFGSQTPLVTVQIDQNTGRYRMSTQGVCYFEANESGPNLCTPLGRFVTDGVGQCTWDPNGSGPNMCTPNSPAEPACTFDVAVTPSDTSFGGTFAISTQPGCAWTASSDTPNLVHVSQASGTGSGSVSFDVEPTTTLESAAVQLTVAGQTFQVLPESSAQLFRLPCITLPNPFCNFEFGFCQPIKLCFGSGSPTPTPNNTGGNTNGGGGSQGCGTLPEQTPCPREVTITNVDLEHDQFMVSLSGGWAGPAELTVWISGGAGGVLKKFAYSAGTYNLPWSEILQGIEPGAYGTVRVAWGGVAAQNTPTVKFYVLGRYRHSQYNTPVEAMCSGAPATAYRQDLGPKVCNNWSAATPISVKLDFRQKVLLNGHGYSIDDGILRASLCDADNLSDYWTYGDHVFPDAVNMGAYGPVSESTVARYVSKYGEDKNLAKNDKVLIVGMGSGLGTIKTVTDTCPACGDKGSDYVGHLDNWTSQEFCDKRIVDLGKYLTIRVNR